MFDPPMTDFKVRAHDDRQQSLFGQSDFVIPDGLRSFRKSISAIYAVSTKAESSTNLNARRLMDAAIMVVQIDYKMRGPEFVRRIQEERVSPVFEVRIAELVQLAGIPGKNYTRVYEALDQLFETVLKWNILGEDKAVDFEMKSHFFSMIGYGDGAKRGVIRFAIDPSILGIIMEPSIWASLSLGVLHNLKTSASYALYQACWRYVGTANKVTAILPTYVWIEIMLGQSRHVVTQEDGTKRVEDYSDFKRRFLTDALTRINEVPALNYTLELKEYRSGTKVTRLQFCFVQKKQESLGLPMVWSSDVLAVLKSIYPTDKDIEDLAESTSQEMVVDALSRLKVAADRMKGNGVRLRDRRSYFEGILRNLQSGMRAEEISDESIEKEAREIENEGSRKSREKELRERFDDHARERFRDNYMLLPAERSQALLAEFFETEAGAKAKIFIKDPSKPISMPVLSLMKAWMATAKEADLKDLLPEPQDRSYEDWLAWRASLI